VPQAVHPGDAELGSRSFEEHEVLKKWSYNSLFCCLLLCYFLRKKRVSDLNYDRGGERKN